MNGSLTSEWVLGQIKGEIEVVNKIKKYNIDITETFTNGSGKVGVMDENSSIEEPLMYDEDCGEEVCEEVCNAKCEAPNEGYASGKGSSVRSQS